MPSEYDKAVHLGFIREEIGRAANNSASCKKWALAMLPVMSVVLSGMKLPIIDDTIRIILMSVMLMLIVGLWYLDTCEVVERYMLERLYDQVRQAEDASISPYEMSIGSVSYIFVLKVMLSFRQCVLYLPLIVLIYESMKNAL